MPTFIAYKLDLHIDELNQCKLLLKEILASNTVNKDKIDIRLKRIKLISV